MKTLYLDIFSGISGDMFIGAMLDLGVDGHQLEDNLQKLNLDGYHLHISRKEKCGIQGIKFDVHLETEHHHEHEHVHADGTKHTHSHGQRSHSHASVLEMQFHAHDEPHSHGRNFSDIKQLITQSSLSDWVKQKSIAVFHRIAVAEGKIHGHPPDQVHFHEVGAVDSIVDIVGACLCLEMLSKPHLLAAPVIEGTGFVKCAHGRFPIPAPATLEIFAARGVVVTQCDEPHELVTPTGAALLAEFAENFGPLGNLKVEKIGYGLGTRDNKTRPNVLRAVLGENVKASSNLDWETDTVSVLETNLDDMTPELLGHFIESTLASGALDVFHTPIQMKKNRPGVLLTILCPPADADKFSEMILRQTSAFGVRRTEVERRKLKREFIVVQTRRGEVTIKLGKLNGKIVQASPEYESCRKLAKQTKLPLKQIYDAALKAIDSGEV